MPTKAVIMRALGHSIFTQGETWDELRANVLEATLLHFEEEAAQPRLVADSGRSRVKLPRGVWRSHAYATFVSATLAHESRKHRSLWSRLGIGAACYP